MQATDLRDRRIALVKELSQYVEVNELDSGDYQLTTKDNRLLVMNSTSIDLKVADVSFGIGAGSLQSELEVRDTYVPKYAAALDQLAFEIAQQVNSIHSTAYDLNGNTGIDFFGPLTSSPGAAAMIGLSTDVAGDPTKIAASQLPTGTDNGAAIALANLLFAPVFSGGSVTGQYGALIFAIGSDVASAESGVNEQGAILEQLENRRQTISGVSIEEETLQISQFQRAYEASAQLIQTVDELLQTTLEMLRR
jgi:flagellar hook-associated protein 1